MCESAWADMIGQIHYFDAEHFVASASKYVWLFFLFVYIIVANHKYLCLSSFIWICQTFTLDYKTAWLQHDDDMHTHIMYVH